MQLESACSLNMYLLHVSRSRPRSQKHTSKDKCFSLHSRRFVWGEKENNNDMKDSFTNHFILQSIKTTEHEIMQILLSGRVGIDQTHLDGFAFVCMYVCMCVCVFAHRKAKRVRVNVCLRLCFWVCEPICVCGHWSKAEPQFAGEERSQLIRNGCNWNLNKTCSIDPISVLSSWLL